VADKFTFEHQGADRLWVKAPVDRKKLPVCPDLHLSLALAEELAYALLEAVEEGRKRAL
jgi:hypothetical protein